MYYSLCDRALTNVLTDRQQGALCVLAGPELGQEPVVVRQSDDVCFLHYFCSVSSTVSTVYHVTMFLCILYNIECQVMLESHPYIVHAPTSIEHEASHHCVPATTYTASQHVLSYFLPPSSPSIVTLVIVLLMHDDNAAQAYVSAYSLTWSPGKAVHVLFSIVLFGGVLD